MRGQLFSRYFALYDFPECLVLQRLGERTPRQWQPTASDEAMLVSLGEPLSFFKKGRRRDQKREVK